MRRWGAGWIVGALVLALWPQLAVGQTREPTSEPTAEQCRWAALAVYQPAEVVSQIAQGAGVTRTFTEEEALAIVLPSLWMYLGADIFRAQDFAWMLEQRMHQVVSGEIAPGAPLYLAGSDLERWARSRWARCQAMGF